MNAAPRLAAAVLPPFLTAALGSLVTRAAIPTWYAGLDKPGFTPPNWIFSPVWTVLYAAMAYALWRILSLPASPRRRAAVIAYAVQLSLNFLWSFAFFGAKSPLLGLAVILPLWLAIAVTIRLFWPLDRLAALLLVPYLAWVSYATALNGALWAMN